MDSKQLKLYSKQCPKLILDKTVSFLDENNYSLFNLAYLGDGDWRVMYRNKENKVQCAIFHWGEFGT